MKIPFEDIELGALIGAGTVGAVYRGRLKKTGEAVAVKLLQQAISKDRLVRARFEREMDILQKLQHPNIIHYFGGGNHDGQLFYAMEPVETGTVKELLERFGNLAWPEVASIARQVASALQHAHNHGIIHRDLKPGNLFVTASGQIKLGDFGIARDTHSADLTNEGLTVGTHAYMAPEQITGEANITGKADLYALGCLLFELSTGHKPFQGTNFAVLFEQHLRKPAPRVSDFIPDCPPTLVNMIAQLLEKAPEARPFNARVVQGAMLQLLEQHARQPSLASKQTTRSKVDEEQTSSRKTDVGAASVVDPGMASLARKLGPLDERRVSWQALSVVAVIAVAIIVIAAFAAR